MTNDRAALVSAVDAAHRAFLASVDAASAELNFRVWWAACADAGFMVSRRTW